MEENKFVITDSAGMIYSATIHSVIEILDNRFCIYSIKNSEGNYNIYAGQVVKENDQDKIIPIIDEKDKQIMNGITKELTDIAKKYERRP